MMPLDDSCLFQKPDVTQKRSSDLRMMKIHRKHFARSILRPRPRTCREEVHSQHAEHFPENIEVAFAAPDIMQERTAREQASIDRRPLRTALFCQLHRRLRDIERMALVSAVHAVKQRQCLLRQHAFDISPVFLRDLRRDGPHELPDAPDHPIHPR